MDTSSSSSSSSSNNGNKRTEYPVTASAYKLLEEIGYGRNATVYRAECLPLHQPVSIKCIDLEKCRRDLDEVRNEAQTLSLIHHPNVVTAHSLFIVGHHLWLVMPFMAAGSCLTIMRTAHPSGLDEPVIATLLRECLKALDYLHSHGHIHRDIKAGNILIDHDGAVRLADFGVSACVFDCHNRALMRRTTFVGTPWWMAPEVIDPVCGYDSKADIWSLGITALELAQGHAPYSDLPPMKLLQVQLHSGPPELEEEKRKVFSRSFRDFVVCCLVEHLLKGLPPLWEQVREQKSRDVGRIERLRLLRGEEAACHRRVTSWNFDDFVGPLSSSKEEPVHEGNENGFVEAEQTTSSSLPPPPPPPPASNGALMDK